MLRVCEKEVRLFLVVCMYICVEFVCVEGKGSKSKDILCRNDDDHMNVYMCKLRSEICTAQYVQC